MPTFRGGGDPTQGNIFPSEEALQIAVADAQEARDEAQASASAAQASETNAAASAAAAAASESAAATSETNAAASASAAATSEANAATSEANAATSETNAATSEANAAASYDSFDDRYLGAKASDPTLDNDGDALLTGALYFNTTTNAMRVYTGTSWNDVVVSGGDADTLDALDSTQFLRSDVADTAAGVITFSAGLRVFEISPTTGAHRVVVRTGGLIGVASEDDVDSSTRLLRFENQSGTSRAFIGHNSSTTLSMRNEITSAPVHIRGTNSGAANVPLAIFNPDGGWDLYHNNFQSLDSFNNGVQVYGQASPGIGASQDSLMTFAQQDGSLLARVGFNGSPSFVIQSLNHGASVTLQGEDTGGTVRNILNGDPDGNLVGYYNGTARFIAASGGIFVLRSDGNTDTEVRRISLEHQDGTARGVLGFGANDALDIRNLIHGGLVQLRSEDTGGTLRNLVIGNPDSDVQLYQAGTAVVRTTTAANGGLEANNTSTGTGWERVLTTGDISAVSGPTLSTFLTSDQSYTSTTTLANIPGFSLAGLAASTRYRFRLVLYVESSTAGTNPGLRLRADYTGATLGSSEGRIRTYRNAGLQESLRGLTDSTITGMSAGTTTDEVQLIWEGTITTAASGATVQFQAAQNTSNATATTIKAGSYLEIFE